MLPPNEITEASGIALAELIKSSFKAAFGLAADKSRDLYSKIFEDFNPYMQECYKRNRYVRILCQDDDDVDLLSIYVETSFTNKSERFADHEIGYDLSEGKNAIITGAGGAGKTFFMRKLWLDYFLGQTKTPVFIELKKLSDHSSTSVEAFIRNTLSNSLPESLFRGFMADGRFVFILDGFDELPKDKLDEVQLQILNLAESFPLCSFVVSSRPDTRFSGWNSFKVFEAEPLTLDQTRELCQKVPFDAQYKKVFAKKLTEEFYEAYKSFLSNPLLTIMMMMTFKRNMNISRKMGIFYDEAFGTLYQWHDATKAYSRPKNLDIQQFRRSFGAFCLLSYAREKFDFSRTEIDDLIDQSSRLIGLEMSRSKILDDYERNVNLIRQDGLRYYFIHRSFQEYFAAWALVNLFPHKLEEFAERIGARSSDSVMSMCFDLHRTITVQNYIRPNFLRFNTHAFLKSGLTNEALFGSLDCSILFLVAGKKNMTKGKKARVFVGIGVNLEKSFRSFYRSVQRMKSPDDAPAPDFHLSQPIYSDRVSEALGAFFDRVLEEVVEKRSREEKNHECRLRPAPDLRSVHVDVLSRIPPDSGETRSGVIQLTDKESKFFAELTAHIIGVVNDTAEWCKSEMDFAQSSDNRIDELFLGAP